MTDHPAIIAPDITLSYGKLWRIARGFALRMAQLGIDDRSIVALHSRDMIATIATMLGASLRNAALVSFEPLLTADNVVRPTHFLCTPEMMKRGGENMHLISADWPQAAPEDESEMVAHPPVLPDKPWWTLRTSGTTGKPKYMMISQRCVVARSRAVSTDFHQGQTVMTSLFSCHTRPFMVRATAALLNGCTIVDSIDPQFMAGKGVNLVFGSPSNAIEWLSGRVIAPRMKRIQVSGAPLSDPAAIHLLNSFETVEDVYGASETNKSFVNRKCLENGELATYGVPQDSEVEILDSNGALCPVGIKGSVRVRNSYMAEGYIDEPAATAKCFVDGWFVPGDIAEWTETGALKIAGREDNIINIGGRKLDTFQIEAILMDTPGITDAIAFADPVESEVPGVLAMVQLSDNVSADAVIPAARQACLSKLGAALAPRYIYVMQSFPKTHDGVTSRAEAAMLARSLPRPK
ncbi:AMP-binding protein [Rhodobacterales bacterium HKCCSP123]|nr:AMP-binding protein [Rhodobacterales bacterium HKCCSP123]